MTSNTPHKPIRFVLVGTSHPGSVGSAARALKTMAMHELALVACECDPRAADAKAMAVGADDLVEQAQQHASLDVALADCTLVLGSTARQRRVAMPELSPRAAAARVQQELESGGRVAILFGRERTGLDNDELQRCHAAIHIPTSESFSSLNLAAAVQVIAYECRVAGLQAQTAGENEPSPSPSSNDEGREPPASHAELEAYFSHLDQTLHAIDFHKGRSPDTVMRRLRRLFLRASPSARELRILRGILADAERMARLAGSPGAIRE